MLGLSHSLGKRFDFGSHQGAGTCHGRKARHTFGRGLSAVSRAEGVIHVDVAQSGIGLGEFLVVLLFALVATAVFKHHHLAGLDLHALFQITARQRNGHTHEFAHTNGDAGQRIFRTAFAFGGSTQVTHHHNGGAGVQSQANGRHAGNQSSFIGDVARFVARGIQIGTDQHALAGESALLGKRFQGQDLHNSESL